MAETIYETIGGRLKIQAAVDLFYEKVLADKSLSHFFEGVGMDHLRARQGMFLSMLLGGRIVYNGKDLHSAHEHARKMGLNESHFEAFLKHFRDALEEVGVQSGRLEEILKLLEASRDSVLMR